MELMVDYNDLTILKYLSKHKEGEAVALLPMRVRMKKKELERHLDKLLRLGLITIKDNKYYITERGEHVLSHLSSQNFTWTEGLILLLLYKYGKLKLTELATALGYQNPFKVWEPFTKLKDLGLICKDESERGYHKLTKKGEELVKSLGLDKLNIQLPIKERDLDDEKIRRRIKKIIMQHGKMRAKSIARILGRDAISISKVLSKMVNENEVVKTEDGYYTLP